LTAINLILDNHSADIDDDIIAAINEIKTLSRLLAGAYWTGIGLPIPTTAFIRRICGAGGGT
jgi:hypothetical protein